LVLLYFLFLDFLHRYTQLPLPTVDTGANVTGGITAAATTKELDRISKKRTHRSRETNSSFYGKKNSRKTYSKIPSIGLIVDLMANHSSFKIRKDFSLISETKKSKISSTLLAMTRSIIHSDEISLLVSFKVRKIILLKMQNTHLIKSLGEIKIVLNSKPIFLLVDGMRTQHSQDPTTIASDHSCLRKVTIQKLLLDLR
jgi:hypothetical protein